MELKDWIAVYAALVATGNLVWTLINGWRDSTRARLEVRPAAQSAGIVGVTQEVIAFNVANTGRRPITIAEMGFLSPDTPEGNHVVVLPSQHGDLPKQLTEHQSATLVTLLDDVRKVVRRTYTVPPRRAYVRSAIDKLYTHKLSSRTRAYLWGDESYREGDRSWRFWERRPPSQSSSG